MVEMVEMIPFEGDWSIEQIEEIIRLRYDTFDKLFANNENDDQVWDELTNAWNEMQEYEIFTSKQVKQKLNRLYKEYMDIQNVLDECKENEIDLPPYWTKMVEYMPLAPKKQKRVLQSSQDSNLVKRRKSDSHKDLKAKNVKKAKAETTPIVSNIDVSRSDLSKDNISSKVDLSKVDDLCTMEKDTNLENSNLLVANALFNGLEKISQSIQEVGNKMIQRDQFNSDRFESILSNQQKLLEFSLNQINKNLTERIDSGMNQIVDILKSMT